MMFSLLFFFLSLRGVEFGAPALMRVIALTRVAGKMRSAGFIIGIRAPHCREPLEICEVDCPEDFFLLLENLKRTCLQACVSCLVVRVPHI